VDENDAPGLRLGGIGPLDAVNPVPPGMTKVPNVDRLSGMLPVSFTVYEMITLSPGAKGPTLKSANVAGNGERTVNVAYAGPLVSPMEVTTRLRLCRDSTSLPDGGHA
jgi:hypothetical protein